MSVSLIILIIFGLNLLWAVKNWKAEYDLMVAVWHTPGLSIIQYFTAPLYLVGDIAITTSAVGIFGFSGFQGSAMAILLSNLLSVSFFTPKGQSKEILKIYRHNNKLGQHIDIIA